MIYTKDAIGKDAKIQRLQKKLYDSLKTTWGFTDAQLAKGDFQGYGRCVVMDEDGAKNVKHFVKAKEYRTISVAEKTKFFFLQRRPSESVDARRYETIVELFFIVDLSRIKPGVTHRADAEAENDVEQLLSGDGIWVKSIESGYELAMSGISYKQENDTQPYHVFKYNLRMMYDMDDSCSCEC